MALVNLPRPINRGTPGYQTTQEIPIAGSTQAPQGSTNGMEDPQSAPINEWLKAQPWFQETLKQWGVDPNNINLSIDQRNQLADAARRAGLQFGSSHDIGPGGDWEDTHSTAARNVGIAIGGAAGGVGALGAAGALGGGSTALPAVAGGGAATTSAAVPASLAAVGGGGGLTSQIVNSLISKGIPAAASVLGGAAKGEQTQNNINDQAALQQGNLALNRDKFALEAPNTRLAGAIKASLASNFTPRHTEWAGPGSGLQGKVPTISGGLTGGLANLDPRVKDLANQVMIDELTSQKSGGSSGGGQDRTVPPVGQSSTGDKILGGASLGTSLLGALFPSLGKGKAATPTGTSQAPSMGGIAPPAPSMGDDPTTHTGGLTEDELYQMMMEGQ